MGLCIPLSRPQSPSVPACWPVNSFKGRSVARNAKGGALAMSQILVIDDEVVSRQFLIAVLQRLGLGKVSEAVDGLDALMQLDAGDRVFDLIFCDLDMPRMDGIEFVRHLGERRYRGKLLITSGFDGRVLSSVADLARLYALCLCGVLPAGGSGAIAGLAGGAGGAGRGDQPAAGALEQQRAAARHCAWRGGTIFPAAGGGGQRQGAGRGSAGALAASAIACSVRCSSSNWRRRTA